jgi:spore maturation protein CgeB
MARELIARSAMGDYGFFTSAYQWRFGKQYDCWNDVAQYRLHGVIPKYVEEFIANIELTRTIPVVYGCAR